MRNRRTRYHAQQDVSPAEVIDLRPRLGFANLRGDLYGGVTAAVVVLPLALAFGVASGAGPVAGVYGAICVGLFAALFGGTPAQVSGPTGPMTVVMAAVYTQYAQDPAIAFTVVFLAGLIQIGLGVLRLGRFINLMPYPVIYFLGQAMGRRIYRASQGAQRHLPCDVGAHQRKSRQAAQGGNLQRRVGAGQPFQRRIHQGKTANRGQHRQNGAKGRAQAAQARAGSSGSCKTAGSYGVRLNTACTSGAKWARGGVG